MARDLHEGYRRENQHKLPENLRPWKHLPRGYKRSNHAQAVRLFPKLLAEAGLEIHRPSAPAETSASTESLPQADPQAHVGSYKAPADFVDPLRRGIASPIGSPDRGNRMVTVACSKNVHFPAPVGRPALRDRPHRLVGVYQAPVHIRPQHPRLHDLILGTRQQIRVEHDQVGQLAGLE